MGRTPFELRVMMHNGTDPGVALYQRARARGRNGAEAASLVVRAWGTPLRAVTDQLLQALRAQGYRSTDYSSARKAPFVLEEPAGVRLALLLLAVKPLRKLARIEAVGNSIRRMSDEEAYYWFSKCSDRDSGRRAQKALRVLMAEE